MRPRCAAEEKLADLLAQLTEQQCTLHKRAYDSLIHAPSSCSGPVSPLQTGDCRAHLKRLTHSLCAQVDIVVDETYALDPTAYDLPAFLATFNITHTSDFRFLTSDQVYRYAF